MAATQDLPHVDDLTGTCWRDDVSLQAYGGLLSHITALDYFAISPFYDATSNNEVAKQRGLTLEQLPRDAPGTQFILQDAQPPHLFVIRKQFRSLTGAVSLLSLYYILDGTIYQAPSLHAVLSARIDRCLWRAKSALDLLKEDLDPLAERGLELLGGEVTEEIQRQEVAKEIAVTLPPEQRKRAERAVLATLLEHPLPASVAILGPQQQDVEQRNVEVDAMEIEGDTSTGIKEENKVLASRSHQSVVIDLS